MQRLELTIPGRPVPAVRMTQRGKFVKKRAAKYLAYKNQVAWIAKANRVRPISGDVVMTVVVYLHGRNFGDVDNYYKGISDSLNGIAYRDDKQVRKIVVERRECGPDQERAEVIIESWEVSDDAS